MMSHGATGGWGKRGVERIVSAIYHGYLPVVHTGMRDQGNDHLTKVENAVPSNVG